MVIPLHQEPLPLQPGPQPEANSEESKRLAAINLPPELSGAPSLLEEWVGREDILALLNQDWTNLQCRIVGLIGFGGEGKSSIARHWVDQLLRTSSLPQPDGVFWWGFYERRNVDEFFESSLNYLSKGKFVQESLLSSHAKANFLAAMLRQGRYLFILDGVEVLQHQDGDEYGLLINKDLLEFLSYFAATEHDSFCVITSRAPLYDFLPYITYTHRDVNRLTDPDGRALLYNLGVREIDEQHLNRLVNKWEGHALTLSLLATYLKQHPEDVDLLLTNLASVSGEEKYSRVRHLLRRYDEHLTSEERKFLIVFSAFRLPVPETVLNVVADLIANYGDQHFFDVSASPRMSASSLLLTIVNQLVEYKIIRHNSQQKSYTTHPLIRSYYQACLVDNPSYASKIHQRIADFYLEHTEGISERPTIAELIPFIEIVHHLCTAGEYDQAYYIWWDYICQRTYYVLERQLGACQTELELISEFFPNGDTSQEPLLSKPRNRHLVIRDIGHQMKNLGHLRDAAPFYIRAVDNCVQDGDWYNACAAYKELASLCLCLGELENAAQYANEGLSLISFVNNRNRAAARLELVLKARLGWILHLLGERGKAGRAFQEAERIQRQITQSKREQKKYLYGSSGMYHAKFLLRINKVKQAWRILWDNLDICEHNGWQGESSWCHSILGDLFAQDGKHDVARNHYDTALNIARNIYQKSALIGALFSRGIWEARYINDTAAAFNDLQEALCHATHSGYRLWEVDTRIGLAWVYYRAGDINAAKQEAEQAYQMSEEMSYFLGREDAKEILVCFDR